jgi:hypothetical protein
MNTSRLSFARVGAALAVAAVGLAGLVVADETGKMPAPQKKIAHPFLDSLVGSWSTESSGTHEGKESKGTGRSTYVRGIGDTAILQTYESTMPGPDGKTMTYHGHGIYKVTDDGRTLNLWWFCNMSPDVMKLSGPITDGSVDLSGESPMGGRFTLSAKKTPDGLSFQMVEGENRMNETYRRAAAR